MARKRTTPKDIEVVGERRPLLRDLYNNFLIASWTQSIAMVVLGFVSVNFLFALAFRVTGGVHGAESLLDLFFFSVQTSGTIGYGTMYPVTVAAHTVVTIESMVSMLMVALTTGLVFSKFSRSVARVEFAASAVISPYDGVPTLQFRLGNERDSRIMEATLRVVVMRTEVTQEGVTMYRMHNLTLDRDWSPAMSRSWTVFHRIVDGSPLHGETPASLAASEVEFLLTLRGADEVSSQQLHAQKQYSHAEVRWGARHADLLSELPGGRLKLDMARFHELVPTRPTADFPYGEGASPAGAKGA